MNCHFWLYNEKKWYLIFLVLLISFFPIVIVQVTAEKSADTPTAEKQRHSPSDLVKLVVLNVSESANEIQCRESFLCPMKAFYGMKITTTSIVDNKRQILMEFSPKADCTSATVMFLKNVGFRYGIEFTGWPHSFRDQYYNVKCGKATPCMYYRNDWFRFKVVRNPWDRAVSSYIHIMKYPQLREKVVPSRERHSLSFAKFVSILEKLSPRELQGFAGAHAGYQSQPYERLFYRSNITVFHEIVQAEDPHETLRRINDRLGANFSLGFRAHHYAERRSDIKQFVGYTPWNLLQNQIPSNYGLFYNQDLKLRVHQIYLWDILLYNYSFPFTLHHLHHNLLPPSPVSEEVTLDHTFS